MLLCIFYTSGTHAQAHTTITIKLRITINQVSGLDNPWSPVFGRLFGQLPAPCAHPCNAFFNGRDGLAQSTDVVLRASDLNSFEKVRMRIYVYRRMKEGSKNIDFR